MEDVYGDLRYFSTTDYDYDDLLMERLYADLEDEDSGIGRRAAIIGGAGALGAAGATGVGAYLNRKAAYDAALAGKKKGVDYQLLDRDLKSAEKANKKYISGLKKQRLSKKDINTLNNLKKLEGAYNDIVSGKSTAFLGEELGAKEIANIKKRGFKNFATDINKGMRAAQLADQYSLELAETGKRNKNLVADIKKLKLGDKEKGLLDELKALDSDKYFKDKQSAEKALNKLTKKYETEAAKAGKEGMWKFGKKGAAGIALGGLGLAGAAALATRRRDE